LKESTNLPAVEHEAAVPFKSRLLSLKWPGGQLKNQPMPTFQEQSPPTIGDITQLLSEKDSVSLKHILLCLQHLLCVCVCVCYVLLLVLQI